MDNIPVLLVDDHSIVRQGVRLMLTDSEFFVVGEASSGAEAVALVRKFMPKLVLLDIRMQGDDGFAVLASLKKENPKLAVVMLSTYDNPTYMARAVAGGASGYLLKGIEQEELLAAMRTVAEGDRLISPLSLAHSLRSISDGVHQADLIAPLTQREEEVLHLLSTGLTNHEIADLLFVSAGTVKTHVGHIVGKLGVTDRTQAAVWAARQGLVTEANLHALSTR